MVVYTDIMESIINVFNREPMIEAFSNYTYKPSADKKDLLYDFYMLSALPEPEDEKLAVSLQASKDAMYPYLKSELLDAVLFAVGAELRHVFDLNSQEKLYEFAKKNNALPFFKKYTQYYKTAATGFEKFIQREENRNAESPFKDNKRGYLDSYNALVHTGYSKKDMIEIAGKAFDQLNWGSSYGGKAWKGITDGWVMLNAAEKPGDMVVAIDHVYDLQHNTDTVFNKLSTYYKDGYRWIKKALDKKAKIKDLYEIRDDVSDGLRSFSYAVIKDATGKTLEEWLKPEQGDDQDTDPSVDLPIGEKPSGDFKVGDKVETVGKRKGEIVKINSRSGIITVRIPSSHILGAEATVEDFYPKDLKKLDVEPHAGFKVGDKVTTEKNGAGKVTALNFDTIQVSLLVPAYGEKLLWFKSNELTKIDDPDDGPLKGFKFDPEASYIVGDEVVTAAGSRGKVVVVSNTTKKAKVEFSDRSTSIIPFKNLMSVNKGTEDELSQNSYEKWQKSGTWKGGTWKGGTWKGGTWKDGIWEYGLWKGGTWKDGTWEYGTWKGGTWKGGYWKGGTWKGGTWKDGDWKSGTWEHGTWNDGIWYDGTWEHGTWKGGYWKGGTWKGGTWKDGDWYDGTWLAGTWLGGNWKGGTWFGGYIIGSDGQAHKSDVNPNEFYKRLEDKKKQESTLIERLHSTYK